MNNVLKCGIAFLVGVVAGAFGANYYLKEKYTAIADEEIASVKKIYYANLEKQNHTAKDLYAKYQQRKEDIKKMDRIVGNYTTENRFKDKEDEMANKESPSEKTQPYRITDDEFADPEPYYEKVTVSYFVNRGDVVDSVSGEPVEISSIGDANLSILATDDDDTMYVRNEELGMDFEVVRYDEEI